MTLAKAGQICNVCQPNALMTLKEYLTDYASEQTKAVGEALIAEELQHIKHDTIREKTMENLAAIERGERDFRF